jgi:hypothetical protein
MHQPAISTGNTCVLSSDGDDVVVHGFYIGSGQANDVGKGTRDKLGIVVTMVITNPMGVAKYSDISLCRFRR